MSDWSPFTWSIIATVVFAVLGLAHLLIGWARRHSWRAVLRGLGIALVPIGLLIMGVLPLCVRGVYYLIDWAQRTPLDVPMMIGLGVAGFGVLVYLVGSFIAPVSAAAAAERRAAERRPGGKPSGAELPSSGRPEPTRGAPATPTPEADDEIDAILRRHGIE